MENNFENLAKEPLQNNLQKSRFGLYESALATLVFILLNIAAQWILSFFDLSNLTGSFWYYPVHIFIEAMFALAAFIVTKTQKLDFIADTGMKNKVSWPMVGWCFLVSFVSLYLFGNLTNVFLEFISLCGYESILGGMEINNAGQYIGTVISSCVVAAFCEELLFRGVILSGFRKYGFKISVFVSALIFMLMHGNAEQTVHQFIIGVIVGIAFYKTGNLWIGVLIHFFNNLIPVTQVFILSNTQDAATASLEAAAETTQIGFGTVVVDLIMALLFAWAGYTFIKWIFGKIFAENKKLNGEYQEVSNKTSVVIDGTETTIDMSIDGVPVENTQEEVSSVVDSKKKEPIPMSIKIMFVLSGLYLIGNWLLYTIYGFIV